MAIPQKKFRELVLQILYSFELGDSSKEALSKLLMKELAVTKKVMTKGLERVDAILKKCDAIDELITKTSRSYSFNRIQSVEKNILRLGVFEILYDDEVPPKVAITEAIRMARKFGTPESALFINALLDTIYKKSEGEKIDPELLKEAASSLRESEKKAKEAIDSQ